MAHMRSVAAAGGRQRVILVTIMVLSLAMSARNCACAQSLSSVYTTGQDYSIERSAGSVAGLFCALLEDPNPYACEVDAWVAYSVSLGMSMDLCGQCIQITNTAAGGGSIKACILDQKEAEGLDLELPAFQQIDNAAGDGTFNGHMITDVEFVDC